MNLSETTLSLLGTVLSLVLAVGGAILIPLLRKWLAAKVGNEKADLLFVWAETFVKAAEQATINQGKGAEKFSFVLDGLRGIADSQKIKVDEKTLKAAIEAAVLEMKKDLNSDSTAIGNVVVASGATPVVVEGSNGNNS